MVGGNRSGALVGAGATPNHVPSCSGLPAVRTDSREACEHPWTSCRTDPRLLCCLCSSSWFCNRKSLADDPSVLLMLPVFFEVVLPYGVHPHAQDDSLVPLHITPERSRCTPARDCRAPGYDGAEPSHRGLLMPSSFTRFKTHAFPLRRRQWLVHRHRRSGSLGWPTSASTWTAYVSHVLLFFLLTIHPQGGIRAATRGEEEERCWISLGGWPRVSRMTAPWMPDWWRRTSCRP